MTEFVVTASLVLVPLFLMVPLIGKYIDMRQSAVQAARYQAWEYTAWYDDSWHQAQRDRYFQGFDAYPNLPARDPDSVRNEARNRVLARADQAIRGSESGSWDDGRLRALWHDHTGAPLYTGEDDEGALEGPGETPKFNAGFAAVMSGLQWFYGGISSVMSTVTGDGFHMLADTGDWQSQVALAASPGPRLGEEMLLCFDAGCTRSDPLMMQGRGGLLTLGWNGGGREQVASQQRGLLLTTLVGKVLTDPVNLQGLASTILLSPELDPAYLDFGHVAPDVVPNERVGDDTPSCSDGFCGRDSRP